MDKKKKDSSCMGLRQDFISNKTFDIFSDGDFSCKQIHQQCAKRNRDQATEEKLSDEMKEESELDKKVEK